MKIRWFIILLVFAVALSQFNCAPKAAKSKSTVSFNEDLSDFRPPAGDRQDAATGGSGPEAEAAGLYAAPEHDITDRLDIVLNERLENNQNNTITVYTVQVYIGRSREEANEVRMKVFDILPDSDPQLVYSKLRFKVQVGRYYDRVSAYKTFTTLKEEFPGAMLVPEAVNIEDLTRGN